MPGTPAAESCRWWWRPPPRRRSRTARPAASRGNRRKGETDNLTLAVRQEAVETEEPGGDVVDDPVRRALHEQRRSRAERHLTANAPERGQLVTIERGADADQPDGTFRTVRQRQRYRPGFRRQVGRTDFDLRQHRHSGYDIWAHPAGRTSARIAAGQSPVRRPCDKGACQEQGACSCRRSPIRPKPTTS